MTDTSTSAIINRLLAPPVTARTGAQAADAIDRMRAALESIAGWRKVNISAEYEHGLRDIIRSITDCAQAALDATIAR